MTDKTITLTAREREDLKRFLEAYSASRQHDARIMRAALAGIGRGKAGSLEKRTARRIEADANAALALIDKLEA